MRKRPSIQLQHRIHNCIRSGFFEHRNKIGENRKTSHDQGADLLLRKQGECIVVQAKKRQGEPWGIKQCKRRLLPVGFTRRTMHWSSSQVDSANPRCGSRWPPRC